MLKKVTALILILVLCFGIASCGSSNSDSLMEAGKQALEMGEYETAVDKFTAQIDADELCVEAYIGLAKANVMLGEYERAEEVLNTGYDKTSSEEISTFLGNSESAILEFERVDISSQNSEDGVMMEMWYDNAFVETDNLKMYMINNTLNDIHSDYLANAEAAKEEYGGDTFNDTYVFTREGEETYNQNGILSIKYEENWYMGGTIDTTYYGYTYDLKTGKPTTLEDLFDINPVDLLDIIKSEIRYYVDAEYNEGLTQTARDTIEGYTLDSFNYYLGDAGKLFICIPTYELGSAADGAHIISCDVYSEYENAFTNAPESDVANPANVNIGGTQSTYPADFIGKTCGELFATYGTNFAVNYFGGGAYIHFPPSSPMFFTTNRYYQGTSDVQNGDVIDLIICWGDYQISNDLTSEMTYPELASALQGKVTLSEPEYFYSELDSRGTYSLEFSYQGHSFSYSWNEDPNAATSTEVIVQ